MVQELFSSLLQEHSSRYCRWTFRWTHGWMFHFDHFGWFWTVITACATPLSVWHRIVEQMGWFPFKTLREPTSSRPVILLCFMEYNKQIFKRFYSVCNFRHTVSQEFWFPDTKSQIISTARSCAKNLHFDVTGFEVCTWMMWGGWHVYESHICTF